MAGFNPERTCLNRGPSFPFFPSRPGLGLTPRFTVGLQLFHSSCTQCTARTLHTTHIHHLPRHAMPMPMLCYAMLCSIPEAEFSAQLPDSLILLIHDYYIHNSIMSTVLYFFFHGDASQTGIVLPMHATLPDRTRWGLHLSPKTEAA